MMLAAFGIIFCFGAANNFAQKPVIVGGYQSVAVTDAGVKKAAQFAVSDHSQKNEVSLKIVRIKKAERQVVAGTNYRMCVEVKVVEEGNPDTQFVQIVVYKNLKNVQSVTSWEADACGGGGADKMPIVGGYGDASTADEGVVSAADFAVGEQSQKGGAELEIVKIHKAAQQVVAGMNYKMCIEVKVVEAGNPDTQFVETVVYKNLKNEFSLTSWKPDACSKK